VLLPGEVIPLHIFEVRYRQLTEHCLAGDGDFGVVLIARGAEVGGGEQRSDIGTIAHIEDSMRFDDGRYGLLARGTVRIRVRSWLADAPYPLATVVPARSTGEPAATGLADAERVIRRARAFFSELGGGPALASDLQIDEDPDTASWQLAALAPFSPFDRQRLVGIDDLARRVEVLTALAAEQADDLERLLASGK
jgi:Lon protease-like protein